MQPCSSLCPEQRGAPQSAVMTKVQVANQGIHLSDWRGAVGAAKALAQCSMSLGAFCVCAVSNKL